MITRAEVKKLVGILTLRCRLIITQDAATSSMSFDEWCEYLAKLANEGYK